MNEYRSIAPVFEDYSPELPTRAAPAPARTQRAAEPSAPAQPDPAVEELFRVFTNPGDEPQSQRHRTAGAGGVFAQMPSDPSPRRRTPPKRKPQPKPLERPKAKVSYGEDGIITLEYPEAEEPAAEPEPAPPQTEQTRPPRKSTRKRARKKSVEDSHPPTPETSEPETSPEVPERENLPPREEVTSPPESEETYSSRPAPQERGISPLTQFLATRAAVRQMRQDEAAKWPDPADAPESPELPLRNAARYYASFVPMLRLRTLVSLALSVILTWIALALPMGGNLGASLRLQAGVSVLLTLSVMVTALDVVTAGFRQLFSLQPGLEAIAALSALLSCIDGMLVLAGFGDTLPYCAVASLTLTAAMWGEWMQCRALNGTYRAADKLTRDGARAPTVVFRGRAEKDSLPVMLHMPGNERGFVHRSEQPDECRASYAVAAPICLLAALVLSIAATAGGRGGYFLHTLSAMLAAGAPFTAFFSFQLPYHLTVKKTGRAGVAIAGAAGAATFGRTPRLLVTDQDLFPRRTRRMDKPTIAENCSQAVAIGYTATLLQAAGSGLAPFLVDYCRDKDIPLLPYRNLELIDSGLSAVIGIDRVLVGNRKFMEYQKISLPKEVSTEDVIYTAVNDELVAFFRFDYTPTDDVADALRTMAEGETTGVVALSDYLVTRSKIRIAFETELHHFRFLPYDDAYRAVTLASRPRNKLRPAALVSSEGLLPLTIAAEAARKLYVMSRLGTLLTFATSCLAMLLLFFLCRSGSFATVSAGSVLAFLAGLAALYVGAVFLQQRK